MDTMVKTSQPVEMSQPRRRVRWLPMVGCFVVIALMAAVTFWAMRPRWHTYTSLTMGTNLALQVDYPSGWQTTSSKYRSNTHKNSVFLNSVFLHVKRTPPTGITRWWYERVLRQKVELWNQYRMEGIFSLRSSETELRDRETLEHSMKEQSAFYPGKVVTRRFLHPLGPALAVIGSGAPLVVFIFPEDTLEHRKVVIVMTYEAPPDQLPQMQSTFDEIVRRVRIVDKK